MKRALFTGITLVFGSALGLLNILFAAYAFYHTFQAIHGCNPNSFISMNDTKTLAIHISVFLGSLLSFVLGVIAMTKPWFLYARRAYDYAFHISTNRAMVGFIINPVIIGYVLKLVA